VDDVHDAPTAHPRPMATLSFFVMPCSFGRLGSSGVGAPFESHYARAILRGR
jgi:hypothetical protein